jgi:hypothetical protein
MRAMGLQVSAAKGFIFVWISGNPAAKIGAVIQQERNGQQTS